MRGDQILERHDDRPGAVVLRDALVDVVAEPQIVLLGLVGTVLASYPELDFWVVHEGRVRDVGLEACPVAGGRLAVVEIVADR